MSHAVGEASACLMLWAELECISCYFSPESHLLGGTGRQEALSPSTQIPEMDLGYWKLPMRRESHEICNAAAPPLLPATLMSDPPLSSCLPAPGAATRTPGSHGSPAPPAQPRAMTLGSENLPLSGQPPTEPLHLTLSCCITAVKECSETPPPTPCMPGKKAECSLGEMW